MHLEARHLKVRHLGKLAHQAGIARHACLHGIARRALLVSGRAPRQHQRSRHALQVPLERRRNRLIEIVDVEQQPSVRRGIGAQVAHMRVAANLRHNVRPRQRRQVRRHDRNRAAKIGKRRLRHQLILQPDQRRHAALHRVLQQFQRRCPALLRLQIVMRMPACQLALRAAQPAPLFHAHPVHSAQPTRSAPAAQSGNGIQRQGLNRLRKTPVPCFLEGAGGFTSRISPYKSLWLQPRAFALMRRMEFFRSL